MKIIWPWGNGLGCLGFRTKNFYLDFFRQPYWGMYWVYKDKMYRAGFWWVTKHDGVAWQRIFFIWGR